MVVLEAKNLTKRYGNKVALDGFSMCLESGRVYGLIGKSGSGKTTLLRAVAGLIRMRKGVVHWGIDRREVGAYVGDAAFHRELSIKDNLTAQSMLLKEKVDNDRIDYIMEKIMLTARHVGNRSVRNMLINQKIGAAVAMAMVGAPELLILDEPSLGLDTEMNDAFKGLIYNEIILPHKTALISAKNEQELKDIATDFIYIDGGRNV